MHRSPPQSQTLYFEILLKLYIMKIASLLLLAVPALARLRKRQGPPPNQIVIVNAQTSGSGCPQGTVSISGSPDGSVVTFGFDAFQTCELQDT